MIMIFTSQRVQYELAFTMLQIAAHNKTLLLLHMQINILSICWIISCTVSHIWRLKSLTKLVEEKKLTSRPNFRLWRVCVAGNGQHNPGDSPFQLAATTPCKSLWDNRQFSACILCTFCGEVDTRQTHYIQAIYNAHNVKQNGWIWGAELMLCWYEHWKF